MKEKVLIILFILIALVGGSIMSFAGKSNQLDEKDIVPVDADLEKEPKETAEYEEPTEPKEPEEAEIPFGWATEDSGKCYYDENGNRVTGWKMIDGNQYHFNSNGDMTTGWLDDNFERYFFEANGVMVVGWKTIDHSVYYFSDDGRMQKGWQDIEGLKCYFNEDGQRQIGWLSLSDKKYYFNSEGPMAEGWVNIDGGWYYFTPKTGELNYGWKNIDGHWYFLSSETGLMLEGWQQSEGNWYYLNPQSGTMAQGWKNISNKWYYLVPESGHMATGWHQIDGLNYLFHPSSGAMLLDPQKPSIALTFDDGPGNYTRDLLDFLHQHDVKATFFVLGQSIPGNEDIIQRMHQEGHSIGNHSYSHPDLTALGDSQLSRQIDETDRLIEAITGNKTVFYRPPYGIVNQRVLTAIDKSSILWNVDTMDWSHRDSSYVVNQILTGARDGSIILMHDIHPTTVEAVKIALPTLISQGYQIVNLDTLFKLKGQTPLPHQNYFKVP